MKRCNDKERELLLLAVGEAVHTEDTDAVERVSRYYEGYINELCTRTVRDENVCPHVCLDEYIKSRLGNRFCRPMAKFIGRVKLAGCGFCRPRFWIGFVQNWIVPLLKLW